MIMAFQEVSSLMIVEWNLQHVLPTYTNISLDQSEFVAIARKRPLRKHCSSIQSAYWWWSFSRSLQIKRRGFIDGILKDVIKKGESQAAFDKEGIGVGFMIECMHYALQLPIVWSYSHLSQKFRHGSVLCNC